MTRPLGASFADWMGKSRHAGGLGIGDGPVAFVLALLIVAMVAFVAATGRDSPRPQRRDAQHEEKTSGFESSVASETAA